MYIVLTKTIGQTRIDIKRFDGKGDFKMWRKKMHTILVHQKCVKVFSGEKTHLDDMSSSEKAKVLVVS